MIVQPLRCFIMTCALLAVVPAVEAQVQSLPRNFGRPGSPPISSNLMLLNRNNSFEFNYLQNLRTVRDFNRQNQNLMNELDLIERQFNQSRSPTPPSTYSNQGQTTTGHPAAFFNYGRYYQFGR